MRIEWRELGGNAIYIRPEPARRLANRWHRRKTTVKSDWQAFMLRVLKALIVFLLFAFLGLVAYAYLGDLSPEQSEVSQPVELDVDQ